jgi:hypothetical protein
MPSTISPRAIEKNPTAYQRGAHPRRTLHETSPQAPEYLNANSEALMLPPSQNDLFV